MADQFGINYGNVLASAEDITAARTRNVLARNQMDDDAQARKLREQALGGDKGALNSLAAVDPAQAAQLNTYISGLKDEERANLAQNTEQIGQAAAYVLGSDDKEAAYQQVRASLPPEIQSKMPTAYDENWTELQLANASTIDQILKRNAAPVATGASSPLGKLAEDLKNGIIDQPTYDAAVAKANALSKGQTISMDPETGQMVITQGGSTAGEMPSLTGQEGKDVGFLTRSTAANDLLAGIDSELTNRVGRAADMDPTGFAREWLQSDSYQKAQQAAAEFKTAILRKDTGAAITKEEDAQYDRLYIPQPGDKPDLIAQKRDARKRAVDALKAGIPSAAIAVLEEKGLLPKAIEEATAGATQAADGGDAAASPPAGGGVTKTVNGVTYTQDANGDWYSN